MMRDVSQMQSLRIREEGLGSGWVVPLHGQGGPQGGLRRVVQEEDEAGALARPRGPMAHRTLPAGMGQAHSYAQDTFPFPVCE